jgi:hypothetical protein
MTARLHVEEKRLRALFQRLVALSLTAAPLGCSSGDDSSSPKDASPQTDATTSPTGDSGASDATLAAADGGASSPDAARDAACDPVYVDGEADGSGCDFFESLACNLPPGTATEGCAIYLVACTEICGQVEGFPCAVAECTDAGTFPSSGPITVECTTGKLGCADGGRKPEGLQPHPPGPPPRRQGGGSVKETADPTGEWLARLAWMEAASGHAFRGLRSELAERGAPPSLVRAAERAEGDERRHARVTSRLARGRGGRVARVSVKRRRARSLEAFARENAIEGCVREAFAALVATWQARHAPDPEIAVAMAEIAADETRHAALAWAIDAWACPQLDALARRSTRAAMQGALRALRCEVAALPPTLARAAGLPSGAEGAALVDAFASALLA